MAGYMGLAGLEKILYFRLHMVSLGYSRCGQQLVWVNILGSWACFL